MEQLLYDAPVELDDTKLPQRISQANSAIVQRPEELRARQGHEQEKTGLQDV